jgi:alpha-glucosidase
MVGASLLTAPVVEPGATTRMVHLPSGVNWYDFWTGEIFAGGEATTRPAPWARPVLFAREGCAIPVNVANQTFAARADRRSFMIFPPKGAGAFSTESFEDDGESEAYQTGGFGGWRVDIDADKNTISVRIRRYGAFTGLEPEAGLIFPKSETRRISISRS